MDAMNNSFSPRAELWQCLAQALLPPRGEFLSRSLRDDLADDLAYLADSLGLDIGDNVEELRTVLAQADVESLLPAYSSLFLVPPIPARLNAGFYLDGTLLGANTKMLAEIFYRHGVEQSPDMHDTPDHLATILEFLALLFHKADVAESATLDILDDMEAIRGLLWRTLSDLHGRVIETEQERSLPAVYSALIQIVKTALRDEQGIFFCATGNDEKESDRRYFTKRETAPDLVACKACGKSVATARELKVIIDRLRQSGLPTDHLELCPDCRDGTRGWKPGKAEFNLPGFR
ncbi:MAG: molecular chaperone TorD family protein [Sulfuricella sp.]|nr:molecular chaperone TorD family protein [Sulfuricella sp.]